MNLAKLISGHARNPAEAGLTLAEVLVALAISCMAVAAIVGGYIFSTASAEKAALSLAANGKAMQRLEETRSAKWDTAVWPQVDELVSTNFPDEVINLDVSRSGAAQVFATNMTSITQLSSNPPLRQIRVDCVWQFKGSRLQTNTIETCRAPDQ